MAPHSSTLAWRIPGTGEPGGLPPMGSHRVGHDWSDLAAAAAGLYLELFFQIKFIVDYILREIRILLVFFIFFVTPGLPGPSVHGILQARILEWVAIPFSGGLPYQGSNLGLWHCRQILYSLGPQWSPLYWWIVNMWTVKVFEAIWCYTSSSYLENKVN